MPTYQIHVEDRSAEMGDARNPSKTVLQMEFTTEDESVANGIFALVKAKYPHYCDVTFGTIAVKKTFNLISEKKAYGNG